MSEDEEVPDPEAQADLLAEETRGLKRCARHPVEVFFDGPDDACPACQVAREWVEHFTSKQKATTEWLAMTKDME